MRLRFAPAVFLVVFCCAYVGVFALDWPLFRYYPLHGALSWGRLTLKDAGPAMAWYGLMANAALIASLLAVVVPDTVVVGRFRGLIWLFPAAGMLACGVLLRRFFL